MSFLCLFWVRNGTRSGHRLRVGIAIFWILRSGPQSGRQTGRQTGPFLGGRLLLLLDFRVLHQDAAPVSAGAAAVDRTSTVSTHVLIYRKGVQVKGSHMTVYRN